MHELPKRRSQIFEHLLKSTSLPNREEAKLKEDFDTDHSAEYAKEEDEMDDTVTELHSLDYTALLQHRSLQW